MRSLVLTLTLGLLAVSAGADEPDWYGSWPRRLKIRFDNRDGEALERFPATIRLTAAQLDDWSGGLRFVDADGRTVLPHEIAWWDLERGAELHVLVPRIDARSTEDFIWLYCGSRATPLDHRARQSVWRASGFVAVYHLAERRGPYLDSAGRLHSKRVQLASPRSNTKGIAGQPIADFSSDRQGDAGDLIDLGAWNVPGSAMTLECFFLTEELRDRRLISKSSGPGDEDHTWMLNVFRSPERKAWSLRYRQRAGGTTGSPLHGGADASPIETSRWYHGAGTYDGKLMRLYQDGARIAERGKIGAIEQDERPIHLGNNPGTSDQHFRGRIDEVRISAVARSRSWLAATAAGLHGRLCRVGPFESRPERGANDPGTETDPGTASDPAQREAAARELLEAGRALEAKGQLADALRAYEKAAASGDGPAATDAAAACFALMRRPELAAAQAEERREAAARGLLSAARMFSKTRDQATAIAKLEQLLRDHARSQLADEARELLEQLRRR